MKSLLGVFTLAVLLTGCQLPHGSLAWSRTDVFFGLSKPDGTLISPAEWQRFVDEEVTPRFPSGLSVVDTSGQWRLDDGTLQREPSKALILLHPRDPRVQARIDEIRRIYCRTFQQEAVMKVTTRVSVAF